MANIKKQIEKSSVYLIKKPVSLKYYQQIICQDLLLKQSYNNIMELPSINKIILNTTSSLFVQDKKYILPALVALEFITGQKIKYTLAKKSIATFKIRQNQLIGCKISLRNQYMYNFLSKFLLIIAPRIRDFSGIITKNLVPFSIKNGGSLHVSHKGVTPLINGGASINRELPLSLYKEKPNLDYSVGIKNLMIFPELENHFELFDTCRGINITFGIYSKKFQDAFLLYSAFQIPTTFYKDFSINTF